VWATPTPPAKASRPRRKGTRIKAIGSQFGTILGDGRGRAVYLFDKDQSSRVLCHNVLEFGGLWLVVRPAGSPVR
jgi:hypothetical protein